ncbi:signal transduction histidine kinase [Prauserella isguenensis]|uniref:Signal transduction histidine kinase n=1 Tax=Prauserella isguenensis TaxID=1470180 RepID=A0A839RVD0_9PSEU|nr:ATP-binding protein [Prauserella isguenensis]MBB3049681.1 signal transduction histidine kinase [Prauserella isguenensis]
MTTAPKPNLLDPITPLWWGTVVLRWMTLAFALGAVIVHFDEYRNLVLAWAAWAAMVVWSIVTTTAFVRVRTRYAGLVVADVVVTCGIMLLSPLALSDYQFAITAPLLTTVWASVAPLTAGARFGAVGGAIGGLIVAVSTGVARWKFDLDVARDGLLLFASGTIIGMAATTARRSQAVVSRAMRAEAATAERERLARSIHDSVLQVLARVRRRGAELGGEAAELAKQAGEQEIALRALVTTEPLASSDGDADLRASLGVLATSRVQISGPASEVRLPADTVDELLTAVKEALSNVDKHAGEGAKAWVLLEELSDEIVLTVRDDGPGIPEGRLEAAAAEGHIGVAQSIRGRLAELGGTARLETAPGAGTEWEMHLPRPADRRRNTR